MAADRHPDRAALPLRRPRLTVRPGGDQGGPKSGQQNSGHGPAGVGCVMAFDLGLRRIGIASCDTLTRTARPRGTVHCGASGPDWTKLTAYVQDLDPQHLVVGLPTHADGTPSTLSGAARRFATELQERFGLPVTLVDEHGSSLEASTELKRQRHQGERRRRVARPDIDSHAAAIILGRWLAGEAHEVPETPAPEPERPSPPVKPVKPVKSAPR